MFKLVASLCLLAMVNAHSWLQCVDYQDENAGSWDPGRCRAYARDSKTYAPRNGQFGADRGYNYQPSNAKACITPRNDAGAYDGEHPMAVYHPGQKVILVHPTKNHCAERCTNKYIPDSGNKIYLGPRNSNQDGTLDSFFQNQIYDMGISPFGHNVQDSELTRYPKPGYQNAPNFCQNTDKAVATYTIYVPNNLSPGRYTFLWAWWFNSNQIGDLYTGCWEADIVSTKAERDSVLRKRGLSTAEPVDMAYLYQ